MNKEESLLDDETIWFGYAKSSPLTKAKGEGSSDFADRIAHVADATLKEHRKRFPRRKK